MLPKDSIIIKPCEKCDSCYYYGGQSSIYYYCGGKTYINCECKKESDCDSAFYKFDDKQTKSFPDCGCYENKGQVLRDLEKQKKEKEEKEKINRKLDEMQEAIRKSDIERREKDKEREIEERRNRERQELEEQRRENERIEREKIEREKQEQKEREKKEYKEKYTCPVCNILVENRNQSSFYVFRHNKYFHNHCFDFFINSDKGKCWDKEEIDKEHNEIDELKRQYTEFLNTEAGNEILKKCPIEKETSAYSVLEFYRNLKNLYSYFKDTEREISEFYESNKELLKTPQMQEILYKYPLKGGYKLLETGLESNFDKNKDIVNEYLEIEEIKRELSDFLQLDIGKKIYAELPTDDNTASKILEYYKRARALKNEYYTILDSIKKFNETKSSFFSNPFCINIVRKYPIDGGLDYVNGEIISNYKTNIGKLVNSIGMLDNIERIKSNPSYLQFFHNESFNLNTNQIFEDISDISDLNNKFITIENEIKKKISVRNRIDKQQIVLNKKNTALKEKNRELNRIKIRHTICKISCLIFGGFGWHYFVYGRIIVGFLISLTVAGLSSLFTSKGTQSFLPLWMILVVWAINCIITFSGNIKGKDKIKIKLKKKKITDELKAIQKEVDTLTSEIELLNKQLKKNLLE